MELEEDQAGSEHACFTDHAGSGNNVELDNLKSFFKYPEILDKEYQGSGLPW